MSISTVVVIVIVVIAVVAVIAVIAIVVVVTVVVVVIAIVVIIIATIVIPVIAGIAIAGVVVIITTNRSTLVIQRSDGGKVRGLAKRTVESISLGTRVARLSGGGLACSVTALSYRTVVGSASSLKLVADVVGNSRDGARRATRERSCVKSWFFDSRAPYGQMDIGKVGRRRVGGC